MTQALDEALAEAHLPVLMLAMVHLTGDPSWMRPEWRAEYVPFTRGQTTLPEAVQAEIREAAKAVIQDYLDGKRAVPPPPDAALVRQMMDFVASRQIPEGYTDFLMDELALDGATRQPAPIRGAGKVLVVGAGMSGILAGIRLSQADVPFEIVEKNPDVGGTWFENTYPGCRVDSSNHMYSYSFEPNHFWPQHFSPQPVLLDYFRGVADRYGLRERIRFETSVEAMAWDEARSLWSVRLKRRDGTEERLEVAAVITAVGQLNRPRLPDIEGRDSFAGEAFHSAQWRHDVDLKGKRVAVIGTGASAFQFVPEIAAEVADLKVFQRSPPWATPAPHYHQDVSEGMKWLLEHVPYYDKWYRFWMFWMVTDGFLPAVKADPEWAGPPTAVSAANENFRQMLTAALAAQTTDRADLFAKIIPDYPVGGKRALLDNGVWVSALKRPNVALITERIERITSDGLVTADGQHHDVDVIIYGTGFEANRFLSPMKIKGRGGLDLHETWAGDARAYLGITTPGFPNLFMIYGPNTNIVVNGSIIFFSECAVRYIVGALRLLADTGAASMEVKQGVHDVFNEKVDAGNRLMAWGVPQSSSWYKNATGRVSQNWPFALIDYWRATLEPNPDDFILARATEAVA